MKLPYGISDFATLITEGYHYVDRTDHLPSLGGVRQTAAVPAPTPVRQEPAAIHAEKLLQFRHEMGLLSSRRGGGRRGDHEESLRLSESPDR